MVETRYQHADPGAGARALPGAAWPSLWQSLLAWLLMGSAAGAAVGAAVSMALGWTVGLAFAAILGALATMVPASLGVAMYALATRHAGANAMALLASSVVRLIVSLGLALMMFLVAHPEGRPFWIVFLAAGLGVIVAEAVWSMRRQGSASAAHPPAGGR